MNARFYKKTYQAYNYEKQNIVIWFIDLKRALKVFFFLFFPVDRGDRGAAVLKKKGGCQSYNWNKDCAPFSVRSLRLIFCCQPPEAKTSVLTPSRGARRRPVDPGGRHAGSTGDHYCGLHFCLPVCIMLVSGWGRRTTYSPNSQP